MNSTFYEFINLYRSKHDSNIIPIKFRARVENKKYHCINKTKQTLFYSMSINSRYYKDALAQFFSFLSKFI